MTRLIPISILALAFWLGSVSASDGTEQNRIVLTDGDWKTVIGAGDIRLEGPDGSFVSISIGHETGRPMKRVRRTEPHLRISGARPDDGRPAASVALAASDREGQIMLEGVPGEDVRAPFAKNGKSLLPFVGIGASEGYTKIRFMENGELKLELPERNGRVR